MYICQLLFLINDIKNYWKLWMSSAEEFNILCNCTEIGRNFTINFGKETFFKIALLTIYGSIFKNEKMLSRCFGYFPWLPSKYLYWANIKWPFRVMFKT